MRKITAPLLSEASRCAKASPRRRHTHNLHTEYSDPLQRLLNAAEPDTYVRPHAHPDPRKIEVFLVLKGRIAVVEFDEEGAVLDHCVIDPAAGAYGVEVLPGSWHTFICLSPGSVLFEAKPGPYAPENDKIFPPWAPQEGTPEGLEFNRKIVRQLGIVQERPKDA